MPITNKRYAGGWTYYDDGFGNPQWIRGDEMWFPDYENSSAEAPAEVLPELQAERVVERKEASFKTQTGDSREYLNQVEKAAGKSIDWTPYAQKAFEKSAPQDANGWSWTDPVVVAHYIMEEAAKDHPEITQYAPDRVLLDFAGNRTEEWRKGVEKLQDAESKAFAIQGLLTLASAGVAAAGAGVFGAAAQKAAGYVNTLPGATVRGAVTSAVTGGDPVTGALTGGASHLAFSGLDTLVSPTAANDKILLAQAGMSDVPQGLQGTVEGPSFEGTFNPNGSGTLMPPASPNGDLGGYTPEQLSLLGLSGPTFTGSFNPNSTPATALPNQTSSIVFPAAVGAAGLAAAGGSDDPYAQIRAVEESGGAGLETVGGFQPQTGTEGQTLGELRDGKTGLFGLPKDLSDALITSGITVGMTGLGQKLFGSDDGAEAAKSASDAANMTAAIAQDQWNYYKQNYQPVEKALISEAMAAGSPEDIARAEGQANAANTAAFDRAQKQMASRLQSFGLNPSAPAYQSQTGSVDLAEAASGVGQRVLAGDTARNLGYAKRFDVAGLGKGIPGQTVSASNAAATAGLNASRIGYLRNRDEMENMGKLVRPVGDVLGKVASDWFERPAGGDTYFGAGWKKSGNYVGPDWAKGFGYKKGGIIAPHMKPMPMKPMMKMRNGGRIRYAMGGMAGLEPATIDNATGEVMGPGNGMSDSVPAMVDGQQPARLSAGEFVVNEAAVNMTGAEMLEAINSAGLRKRGDAGLEPQNDMPMQPMGMRRGGRVCSIYGL